jgi:hypothetical protein
VELNYEQLHDIFHDERRNILNELELLFDKVDISYGNTDYNLERLKAAIDDLQYALSLIKNLDL